jgi:hypothetical protein
LQRRRRLYCWRLRRTRQQQPAYETVVAGILGHSLMPNCLSYDVKEIRYDSATTLSTAMTMCLLPGGVAKNTLRKFQISTKATPIAGQSGMPATRGLLAESIRRPITTRAHHRQ